MLSMDNNMEKYKLEEEINKILNTTDDLELLTDAILDGKLSNDEIVNLLIGINSIIKLKHEKLFDTYKKVFRLDEDTDEFVYR